MATFAASAEVLGPDHPLMKMCAARPGRRPPGVGLADVLARTGGVYETTTPLTAEFRADIRAVAELTSDNQLLTIAELPEVPVSLEHLRELDPQTRVVIFSRLDVSPGELPRWLRPPLAPGLSALLRSELGHLLYSRRGVRIEEHALPDGRFWRSTTRSPGLRLRG
jgi:hypothetical protein